jgi:hypothetical protein
MTSADLIPTGRTSLVKRGKLALQVQTEYAYRPFPRITTTVQKSGQVIQKIERNLDKPISSIEEKNLLEERIRKQHSEILGIIKKNKTLMAPSPREPKVDPGIEAALEAEPFARIEEVEPAPPSSEEASPNDEIATPEDLPKPVEDLSGLTTLERLERLPGQHRVFEIDTKGNFVNASLSREFKRTFGVILKNLRDLIQVFTEVPGVGFARERGVYEIERMELYLLSAGTELFLFYLEDPDYSVDYDELLRNALDYRAPTQ